MGAFVFYNGVIRTQDPAHPQVDWLLVQDGRVVDRGGGQPPLEPLLDGTRPRRIDLRGRWILPAFRDAHVHLTWVATSLMGPDLSGARGPEDVVAGVASWRGVGRGPDAAWIVGDGFDDSTWQPPRLPTRDELDAACADRPVLVKRVCGHVGALNSRALSEVRPGEHTDPRSGRIAETDLWALNDRLRPGADTLAAVLPQVAARLHAHGITAMHDVLSPEMVAALARVAAGEGLPLRVSGSMPWTQLDSWTAFDHLRSSAAAQGIAVLGLKLFVDGSLGAHTAWLRQPYSDTPETRGTPLFDPAELAEVCREADARGTQLMVHAIGDAALERALDALEPCCAGGNPRAHRLEHLEVTPPDLVRRLARSGAWACVQPNFAGRWSRPGGLNAQRLGERLGICNAYRTLEDHGVPLAFGSDCMPLGPLYGLQSAVSHPIPELGLEAERALALYTTAPAELARRGGAPAAVVPAGAGRLAPGAPADLVVLDGDPFAPETRVRETWFAGDRVWGDPDGGADPGRHGDPGPHADPGRHGESGMPG